MTDNQYNSRAFSSLVVDGMERAPSRAMLHAVGFTNADFKKPPFITILLAHKSTPVNLRTCAILAQFLMRQVPPHQGRTWQSFMPRCDMTG